MDLITDVVWNMDAFQHLVMEEQTKELVHALVNHHIESERGTDIIHRKGNGLIILLHGGPGTGKTFTAESVAEIARKPLYCVTCGDIGTNPEQAEKYLESVLYLGKTWGCVVLIDEAEVFLEQRSTDTLDRNALVSVFLRVLEYYEGIMILTTNRVGTFDEAFKSRILLSLHYEALRKPQRKKIWRNFIERLKKLEDLSTPKLISGDSTDASSSVTDGQSTKDRVADMDYQDVLDYLDDLSEHALNGRQIRNIITTARQLAKFRKEIMKYKHIQEVIAVSSKFDEYLRKVKDNLSDDQIAREDQLR